MVAIKGAEKIIPIIPNIDPNTKIENKTARGCNPSFFPISFGVKRFDSNICAVKNIKKIYKIIKKSKN